MEFCQTRGDILNLFLAELKAFLLHVTGSYIAKERSIMVFFIYNGVRSASVHKCSNQISFPDGLYRNGVPCFSQFKAMMTAVIDWKSVGQPLSFNTV